MRPNLLALLLAASALAACGIDATPSSSGSAAGPTTPDQGAAAEPAPRATDEAEKKAE
jgi:hypothetical protein